MEVFSHIKYVIGITLSFSIAHLLRGTVKFIQHPDRGRPFITHLLWVIYLYLTLIHFWWWELRLTEIKQWYFFEYLFIVLYITNYYVICTILYPDDIKDYKDYEDYFFSRKSWFFGLLSISFVADILDTLLKGVDYFHRLGWALPVRNITLIILCLVAIKVNNPKFHKALVILFLLYELFYIANLYAVPL